VRARAAERESKMPAFDVTLDPTNPVPLYHQVASQLQAAVSEGRLTKGDFLPSEIDLAESWGVSRPTARRAIQILVDAGLLSRKRGVGTQVVSQHVRRPVRLSSLYDDLRSGGRKPTTTILAFERIPADEEVAEALEIAQGEDVLHIERLRRADGIALALMRNWLVLSAVDGMTKQDLERGGLYEHIRTRGVVPKRASQVIGARGARDDEADYFGIDVGAPVLYMQRIMRDHHDRVVELGKHAYNPEHYQMVAELTA
jgi:GntR family transcriptional regulator